MLRPAMAPDLNTVLQSQRLRHAAVMGEITGTERCFEALQQLASQGESFDIVVNIQGDEPFIESSHIDSVVATVANHSADMGYNQYALYFSRAMIPHNKAGKYDPRTQYWRKLGIYAYRADFLKTYLMLPPSSLQVAEDLEQNKVIQAGLKIKVGIVQTGVHGVDTPRQLQELENQMMSCHAGDLDNMPVVGKENISPFTQITI
ncbi:hypothetical protein CBR_g29613 [Chara braunii]|uniref:3-deoxy-manno-octulosonate cytidylyltransferase n=1 Tax=Chara braunii TaxID=69332 RepID=A0A388LAW7_CHABU|nr:hypothetical protein CBR_g29613 [Chara braunii]|eukprot:GBG79467.1 hypothetical protein CBR_g29613 [Chara braunii]